MGFQAGRKIYLQSIANPHDEGISLSFFLPSPDPCLGRDSGDDELL